MQKQDGVVDVVADSTLPGFDNQNEIKALSTNNPIVQDAVPQRTAHHAKLKRDASITESWIWPYSVEEFVRVRIRGYSLNICAGSSELGDVRMDLDPKYPGVIKGDMKALPFPDETFDTVIQDPPWKIGYYDRWKPFLECGRVCKVGGIVIYNAYWIPWSHQFKVEEVWVRQDGRYANASIISVSRRMKNRNED